MNKKGRRPSYEYVVYKGDDVVCAGTRQEILEKMQIANNTFDRMASNLTKREVGNDSQRLVVEKVSIAEIEAELGITS